MLNGSIKKYRFVVFFSMPMRFLSHDVYRVKFEHELNSILSKIKVQITHAVKKIDSRS